MAAISSLPKGATFTRMARALLIAKGDVMAAAQICATEYGSTSAPARILRAATTAGSLTPNGTWGEELGEAGIAAREFFGLVSEHTIIGRLSGLRRVPLNIRLAGVIGGTTAQWVGAGKPKPISEMALSQDPLPPRKITSTLVVSHELARYAGPEGEALLRGELIRAASEFLDAAFTDPAAAAVADVSPASITNGATGIASSGNPADDLARLIENFEGDLSAAYLITHPTVAAQMGLSRDSGGSFQFVDAGPRGGSAVGIPLLTSRAVPRTTDGAPLILVDPTGIAFGGGQVELAAAEHASIEMESTPTDPGTASTVLTNLWQRNLSLIRAEIWANFVTIRDGSVAYITSASYN